MSVPDLAVAAAPLKTAPHALDMALGTDVDDSSTVNFAYHDVFRGVLGIFVAEAYGAVGNGSTDDSDAFADCVAAMLAAGGGTLALLPGKAYKLVPGALSLGYNAAAVQRQPQIKIMGPGVDWRATTGSNAEASGGAVLDFQGTPTGRGVGCIETFGTGLLEITGVYFRQSGTAHAVPYIYSTNTTLRIHGNGFCGHLTKTQAHVTNGCNQDAIVLGAAAPPTDILSVEDSRFQGYGTVIKENWFNRIRRGVWGRRAANAVVIRDNTWWNQCGSNGGSLAASGAAIEMQGVSASSTTGAVIDGNLIEEAGYYTAIRLGDYTVDCTLVANNLYDPGVQTASHYDFGATGANYHTVICGFHEDVVPTVSGGSSTSTIINGHSGQYSQFAQKVKFTNVVTTAGIEGTRFEGAAFFAGGTSKTTIQPATDQAEGATLLQALRSAADDVNAGGAVMELTQAGLFTLYDSAGAGTQLSAGGRTRTALGSGGTMLDYTGTGGSNRDFRASKVRLLKVADAAEMAALRASPQNSSKGALQLSGTSGPMVINCTGTPEGAVTAPVGSLALRDDGGAGTTLYIKESGAGNTGWRAV